MTRIICVGDIHAMDRPPANATETYMDDILEMLFWINGYAQETQADAIVWAGDIFHHKQPSRTSHALVLKMISVVEDARKLGVPLYAVTGNHDISNDVLASVPEKQPLGVLYQAGLKELVGWHETLPIFGVPWRQDWTTNERSAWDAFAGWRQEGIVIGEEDIVDPIDVTTALAITHAPIYPPKDEENVMFTLVPTKGPQGIAAAMGHLGSLYYGHIHEDHGIFEVEGVTFANMGAISRGSLTEYNINRQIKVAVWDNEMNDDGTYGGFEEVIVPHKPASEAFRLAEAMEEKGKKLNLTEFLTEVGTSKLDISSTSSVIDHIRARKDVPERIRTKAIKILEEVE